MSQSIPLVKKFFGTAGLQIASRGLVVVIGIILARALGPEGYGLYSFIISLVTVATIPVTAGLAQLLIREIANLEFEKKWDELKGLLNWSSYYIYTLSSVVMLGLSLSIWQEWIDATTGQILWFALILIPLRGTLAKQGAILNGLRKPMLAQFPNVLLAPSITLSCLAILFFSNLEFSVQNLIYIQIFASSGGVLISIMLIRKSIPKQLNSSFSSYFLSRWHKTLFPFTLMTFIATMNTEFASVLLGFLGDTTSVGYFKVAMQGVGLIALGLSAVNTVIGPNIARMYKSGDQEATQALITKSVRLSCLASIPISLFLIFLGDWVITLLFGNEFSQASTALSILCIGQIFNVLMGSVGLVLNMTGNEKSTLRAVSITIVLNIILLSILIPPFKDLGAAIAVCISMICWNLIMAFDAYRLTKLKTWLPISLK